MTAPDDGMALRVAEALFDVGGDDENPCLHIDGECRALSWLTTGDGMLAVWNRIEELGYVWHVIPHPEGVTAFCHKPVSKPGEPYKGSGHGPLPLAVLRAAAAALGVAEGEGDR